MTNKEAAPKTTSMVSIFVSLIYRLTVKLTLEFLKIGMLLAILFTVGALIGLGFIYLVYWAYTSYGGSIFAAACAAVLGVVFVLVVAMVVEFVVKDLLHLTDLPLIELLKIVLKGALGRGKPVSHASGSKDGQQASPRGDLNSSSSSSPSSAPQKRVKKTS